MLGQLWMAVYIAVLYGGSALRGDLAAWNRVLPHGLEDGATMSNAVLVSHLVAAFVIYVAGGLQLLPWLRRHAPRVHRWSGRVFLLGAVTIALGGASMKGLHGGFGAAPQESALLFAAALILVFATRWDTSTALLIVVPSSSPCGSTRFHVARSPRSALPPYSTAM